MLKVKCNSVKLKDFVQDSGEQYFRTVREILFHKFVKLKLWLKSVLLCNNAAVWQNIRIT
jgi:hypothetical protein